MNGKDDLCIMHILLVSATAIEQPQLNVPNNVQLMRLVHGCGLMECTFHLTKALTLKPDWVIQVGLAGSYTSLLHLGQTVVVETEQLGDTGAEEQDGRSISLFELGLSDPNTLPFMQGKLINPYTANFPKNLTRVNGLTVNESSGSENTIKQRKLQDAHIETMEGAAFHYVALQTACNFIQFRGISNVVEPRNRAAWQIPQAMHNLKHTVQHFIEQLAST